MKKHTSFSLFSNKADRSNVRPSVLRVESLEDRQLLSATDLAALAAADSNADSVCASAQASEIEPIALTVLNTTASESDSATEPGTESSSEIPTLETPDVETARTDTTLTFSWAAIEGATGYKVQFDRGEWTDATGTSVTYTDLGYRTTHKFSIYAYNETAQSATLDAKAVTEQHQYTTPNVEITEITDTTVTIYCTVPEGYVISGSYAVNVNGGSQTFFLTGDGKGYHTFGNLTPGTTYTFGVRQISTTSEYTHSDMAYVEATTKMELDAPANIIVADKTDSTLTFSWDAVANATGYEVQLGDQVLTVTDNKATFTGLDFYTDYAVTVKALGDNTTFFSSPTSEGTGKTGQHKHADPTVTVVGKTDSSVTLSWEINDDEDSGYYSVWTGTREDDSQRVHVTEKTYTFEGLDADTEYKFYVRHVSKTDRFTYSDGTEVTATTLAELAAPSYVTATDGSATSLTFTWGEVANATGYKVTLGGQTQTIAAGEELTATFTGLDYNTSYTCSVVALGDGETFVDSDAATGSAQTEVHKHSTPDVTLVSRAEDSVTISWTVPEEDTQDSDYGIFTIWAWEKSYEGSTTKYAAWPIQVTGNSYTFTNAVAVDRGGDGFQPGLQYAFCVENIASDDDCQHSDTATVYAYTTEHLDAPTNLAWTQTGNSVTVAWDAVEGAQAGYKVKFDGRDEIVVNDTTATFENVDFSSAFLVSVKALGQDGDDIGEGAQSDSEYATIDVRVGTQLSAPLDAACSNQTDTTLTFSWTAVANATGYEATFNGVTYPLGADATNKTFENLAYYTSYDFTIKALGDGGANYSDSATVTATGTTKKHILSTPYCEIVEKTTNSVRFKINCEDTNNYFGVITRQGSRDVYLIPDADNTILVTGYYRGSVLYPVTAGEKVTFYVSNVPTQTAYTDYYESVYEIEVDFCDYQVATPTATCTATDSSLTFNWNAVENATGYKVALSKDGVVAGEAKIEDATATSYTFDGLDPYATYDFSIIALGDADPATANYCDSVAGTLSATTAKRQYSTPVVTVDSKTPTTITLSWTVEGDDSNIYTVAIEGDRTFEVATKSVTIPGLVAGTTYKISIRQKADAYTDETHSNSEFAVTYTATTTKLATPTLTLKSKDSSSLTFSWNAVDNAKGYYVQVDGGDVVELDADTREYTVSGLAHNSEHTISVQAKGYGQEFTTSDAATLTATTDKYQLATPTVTVVKKTATTLTISWTIPDGEEDSGYYAPFIVDDRIVEVSDSHTYTFTDLTPGTTVYYGVAQRTETDEYDASGYRLDECVTLPNLLETPENFRAEEVTVRDVTLAWNEVQYANKYLIVYRDAKADGNGVHKLMSKVTDTPYVKIENLSHDYTYAFWIAAGRFLDDGVTSDSAWEASDLGKLVVTTRGNAGQPKTTAPTNVTAAKSGDTLVVSWDYTPDDYADFYAVQYAEANTDNWQTIAKVDLESKSCTFENIDSSKEYTVRVKVITEQQNVDNSNFIYYTTVAPTKIDAPTLDSSAFGTSGTVKWNAVDNAVRYVLKYRAVGDSSWTTIQNKDLTKADGVVSYAIPNYDSSRSYEFKAKSVANEVDFTSSDYCAVVTYEATVEPVVLEVPTLDVADFGSDGTIRWDEVDGAIRYIVKYKTADSTTWEVTKVTTETELTVENWDSTASCQFTIKAVGNGRDYANSSYAKVVSYIPAVQNVDEELDEDALELLALSLI